MVRLFQHAIAIMSQGSQPISLVIVSGGWKESENHTAKIKDLTYWESALRTGAKACPLFLVSGSKRRTIMTSSARGKKRGEEELKSIHGAKIEGLG